jgi:hypothetical protein
MKTYRYSMPGIRRDSSGGLNLSNRLVFPLQQTGLRVAVGFEFLSMPFLSHAAAATR